jgi:hypothetical protein
LHLGITQISIFVVRPEHGVPFLNSEIVGAGFVQALDRERAPAPHVTEQSLHADQSDQYPLT